MLNYQVSASGYPVYHIQIKNSPICGVQIVANCGSSHEDPDSWGVAHFLEHLCFQGTSTKNKHQVSREQSLIGSYNAYTNQFNTVYYFDALNEDFEKGFMLLKEAVFDSCYPENEFEKEKSVIIEEWRMYDNYPSEYFSDYLTEKCFGLTEGHPIIGTQESIRSMNPEKLHRFRNKWYGKDNIFIVVVGNLDFSKVMNTVNDVLSFAPTVETTPLCLNDYQSTNKNFKFETNRFEQAAFGLVGKWISRSETVKQNYIANFFLFALSKYMHEYIRDDLGLCYGVNSQKFSHFDNSHMIISMLTNNDYLEKAEKELTTLFNKIKSEGFPDEIYQISKKQLTYNQVKVLCHSHGIASSIVNGVLGSRIPNWFLNEGSKILDPIWLKQVAEKLTQNDLKEFANQWLNEFKTFAMTSTKGVK